MKKKPSAPKRARKPMNLTLSDDVREKGKLLAAQRGIKFTQMVEQMVRAELREAGMLPPEGKG